MAPEVFLLAKQCDPHSDASGSGATRSAEVTVVGEAEKK